MKSQVLQDLFNLDMRNAMSFHNFVVECILFALVLLLSTHCFTTVRYSVQRFRDRRYRGKEPLTLPYTLPGVGSALNLITNPHGFFKSIV